METLTPAILVEIRRKIVVAAWAKSQYQRGRNIGKSAGMTYCLVRVAYSAVRA
jgi:hypothetical protein